MAQLKLIVNLTRLRCGQLRAFGDVSVCVDAGEITMRGFRVVQKDGHPPWVGDPSVSYTKNGNRVNKPVLEFSRELHKQIHEAIITEYQKVPTPRLYQP